MLVTKTVYSLYFPETRRIVDDLWGERPHRLYEKNYTKVQDAMHGPFLERYRAWAEDAGVTFGSGFPHAYPTAGATEGIQALLARIATNGPVGERPRIHVFEGEYEGYQHVGAALSLETQAHARLPEHYGTTLRASARRGDWFLISQPSAIDGTAWAGFAEFVAWTREHVPELTLAVDLTYVGAVSRRLEIDLTSPNVGVVLGSLSKPYGVYYHRIGALLSRTSFVGLHGNLWFKNLFSLVLGERLMSAHPARDLPSRYAPLQRAALERAVSAGAVAADAEPCDVVVLACARLPAGATPSPALEGFVRARGPEGVRLRFCLTPAMDALIQESQP